MMQMPYAISTYLLFFILMYLLIFWILVLNYLFMDWFFCYPYLLIFLFFLFHVHGCRCWWPTCSSVSRHPWVWVWAWGSQRCRPPSPLLLSQEHSKALHVEPSSMLPSLRQVSPLPLTCMCCSRPIFSNSSGFTRPYLTQLFIGPPVYQADVSLVMYGYTCGPNSPFYKLLLTWVYK